MPDRRDDDPPDNVIPFVHLIPGFIAAELRRYYQALLSEPLPPDIVKLFRQYENKEAATDDNQAENDEPPKEKV
jgi:hypothetical protein